MDTNFQPAIVEVVSTCNAVDSVSAEGKPKPQGRWLPGQSGNPSGRPQAAYRISDLAKQHTEEALATLVEICRNKEAPPGARVNAATVLLDRAWGKPVQAIEAVTVNADVKDWRQVFSESRDAIEVAMAEAREKEKDRWKIETVS